MYGEKSEEAAKAEERQEEREDRGVNVFAL